MGRGASAGFADLDVLAGADAALGDAGGGEVYAFEVDAMVCLRGIIRTGMTPGA